MSDYRYGPNGIPVAAGSPFADPLGAPTRYTPASLNPPSRAEMGGRGQNLPPFMRTNVYPPQLLLSTNSQVAAQTRFYTTGILNQAVNVQAVANIQFDIPAIIYGMSAAVQDTGAPGIGTVGLNGFTVSLEHSNGDRITTNQALGGCIFGTASEPQLIGGNGIVFDRGSTLVINVTPLLANLRIDFNFFAIEQRGPRNLTR